MNKTGDVSSAFIREDGQKALEAMVDYTSTPKCISSLTTPGLGWVQIEAEILDSDADDPLMVQVQKYCDKSVLRTTAVEDSREFGTAKESQWH